jgi:hypothetical protein
MPLEGHAERLQTPLGSRDRRLIGGLAVLAVLGAGVGAYASSGRPAAPAGGGCVVVTVPSTMGGARLRNCGLEGARFCRSESGASRDIALACRREGYAAPSSAG